MSLLLRIVQTLLIIPVLLAAPTGGAGAQRAEDGWALLEKPRMVAIMRHATAPGTGDPENFRIGDCSTQRNLDESGREQARAIGRAVRAAGIRIDRVYSSEWCRCLETARLLEPAAVETLPVLNSFFSDRSTESRQTVALRAFLSTVPEDETVFLVTHQVNITALTGVWPSSGEVLLLEVKPEGQPDVVDRLLIRP